MKIYYALQIYSDDDTSRYQCMKYDLLGTARCLGLKRFIEFLRFARFSKRRCEKLCDELNLKNKTYTMDEKQQVYKCWKCGHEFTDADWQKNENGELYFDCPDCRTVWFKEEAEAPEDETKTEN